MKSPYQLISKILFLLLAGLSFCVNANAVTPANNVHVYTVKGEIVRIVSKTKILIKHEAIPDYVDETGAKVGMSAMTMPFSVSESLSLDQFKVGDKIEFVFHSWWKPKAGDEIVKMSKLQP